MNVTRRDFSKSAFAGFPALGAAGFLLDRRGDPASSDRSRRRAAAKYRNETSRNRFAQCGRFPLRVQGCCVGAGKLAGTTSIPNRVSFMYADETGTAMPEEIDPAVADDLVSAAMGLLSLTPGKKVLCTKRQLRDCMLRLAQEAYAMGYLSEEKMYLGSRTLRDATERPAWMDIRLDDPEELIKHKIRLRPIAVRSLLGAGYRCLGDLCWVSEYELRRLFYIGRTTMRQLRIIIRQFQNRSGMPSHMEPDGAENLR